MPVQRESGIHFHILSAYPCRDVLISFGFEPVHCRTVLGCANPGGAKQSNRQPPGSEIARRIFPAASPLSIQPLAFSIVFRLRRSLPNGVGLRKNGRGKSAKDGAPRGHEVAKALFDNGTQNYQRCHDRFRSVCDVRVCSRVVADRVPCGSWSGNQAQC